MSVCPLENISLTRKQAKKTKKTDISREQHSKQANIRHWGSCEKLHKKLRFADPVFITPSIFVSSDIPHSYI